MAKGLYINILLLAALLFSTFSHSRDLHNSGIVFIENRGQWPDNILFQAKTGSAYVFLERDKITFNLFNSEDIHDAMHRVADSSLTVHAHAFQMVFRNADKDADIIRQNPGITKYNFIKGNNPSRWKSTRGYSSVTYKSLFPSIDFHIYSSGSNIKYEFIVHPEGDPADIVMEYLGAEDIALKDNGDLIIKTSVHDIIDTKPVSWIQNKEKRKLQTEYSLSGNTVNLLLENYKPGETVVIDPELIFSTYSGSVSDNFGYTATFDNYGFLYSGSTAFGNNYPVTLGAYQLSFAGGFGAGALIGTDIAISKYDTSGKFMVYSTYLGGIGDEVPHSIVVNENGELFMLGTSSSFNYPTTQNAYDTTFHGGPGVLLNGIGVDYATGSDIVISCLSASGADLLASTFIGGSGNDGVNSANNLSFNYADELRGEIDLDEQSNVYIASCTQSSDFPVTPDAFQLLYGGGAQDACVFKMDRNLTTMIFSTFLGGESQDAAYSLYQDEVHDVYVTGGTNSQFFPVTPGAWQAGFAGGNSDGFIAKVGSNGMQLLMSSYFGSPNYDQMYFIDLDDKKHIHVFGQTNAPDSTYIENALYSQPNSGQVVTKFSASLDSIIWSTVFGSGKGSPDISPTAFLVDVCNKVYISGWGSSGGGLGGSLSTNNLDISPDAFQSTTDGNDFYLMVLEDDASSMFYATYFGGNLADEHVDGGTSRFDKKGFIYQSVCAGCGGFSDFPIKPVDAVSPTNNSPNCNNGVFKLDLGLPIVIADFDMPGVDCSPATIDFTNLSKTEGPGEYFWDFGDGNTSTDVDPSHTYTASGVYRVSLFISDSLSCNAVDSITKLLVILSNSTAFLDTIAVCSPGFSQIGLPPDNDSAVSYTWTPATGLSQADISNPLLSITNDASYTLLVSNGVCTDTFFQEVLVFVDTLDLSPSSLVLCPGDTVTINLNNQIPSNNLTYSWEPAGRIIAGANSSSPQAIITGSTIFDVTATNSLGCEYQASVGVGVFQKPVEAQNNLLSVCPGDTVLLKVDTLLGGQSINYNWQPSAVLISANTLDQPLYVANQEEVFYLEYQTSFFCTFYDTVDVRILDGQSSFLPDVSACDNNPVTIGPVFPTDPSLSYQWFPTSGLTQPSSPVTDANPGTETLYSLVLSNGNCEDTLQQWVRIFNNDIQILGDTMVCSGNTFTLQSSADDPSQIVSYDWSPDAVLDGSDGNSSANFLLNGDITIILEAQNSFGCVYSDSVEVLASTNFPSVSASANPDTVEAGETIVLNSTADQAVIYSWNPVSLVSEPDSASTAAMVNQTTLFTLMVTNNEGCSDSDSVLVVLKQEVCGDPFIFVPNAFSPNGDGKNDELLVRGSNITDMYFAVYDRWGERVFETQDQSIGWDGVFKGASLDPAVFAFYLEVVCDNGEQYKHKGNVTLFR